MRTQRPRFIKIALERRAQTPTHLYGGGRESVWILSVANQIAFSDDSPSFKPEQLFQPGHSLANTRDRLALAFHGRATLDFLREEGDWVKVVLRLPVTEGR